MFKTTEARVLVRFAFVLFAAWTGLLTFSAPATAGAPSLNLSRETDAAKLRFRGEAGQGLLLETAPQLDGTWKPWVSLAATGVEEIWFDPDVAGASARFYRAVSLPLPLSKAYASNFRLLDQNGKAHELYYHGHDQQIRAIVLVFTRPEMPRLPERLEALRNLRDNYPDVLFWLIQPGPAEERAGLASAGSELDLTLLHDRGSLIAQVHQVETAPEVIGVDPRDYSIFYRGAMDGQGGPQPLGGPRNYLSEALERFLSKQTISPSRVRAAGTDLDARALNPSYSADIAPLLANSCVVCHSPGNIGPFAMTNYSVVQNFARAIRRQVILGNMPPWHADPHYGVFANDVSLDPEETVRLVAWLDAGAPRGDGPDPLEELFAQSPPPPDYPNAWPADLGPPDHILSIPTQSIPATGDVPYKYPAVTLNLPENVWLRAAVVRPGNTKVVHHSLVFVGSFLEVFLSGAGLNGYFAGYVPGMRPTAFPEGTGKPLARNATLTFQMHYISTGQPETDRTELGLYFMKTAPEMELLTRAAANISITIPPGAREYEREAQTQPSATKDVLLYEMSPHMHYRGARFQYEALYPDGTSEVLLSVPHYDFHWQSLYRLKEPKRLPAGTIIRCRGAFDNSHLNHANPDPTVTVRFGEQTNDEMFIGYFNYSIIP
jgi:hypothetical protein